MNYCFTILIILFSFSSTGQGIQINGKVNKKDSTIQFDKISIFLLKAEDTVGITQPSTTGLFEFKNVLPGSYIMTLYAKGHGRFHVEDIQVRSDDGPHNMHLTYPYKCLGLHVTCCFRGECHDDNLIPIYFNKLSEIEKRKVEEGLAMYGGESDGGCEQIHYCKVHKIRF